MRLYIIGNGFDLNHGLETRYSFYYDFLQKSPQGLNVYTFVRDDDKLSKNLSESKEDFWNALEDNLYPKADELVVQTADVLGEIEITDLSVYREFTCDRFCEWIKSIDLSTAVAKYKILQSEDALFLSFNYTLTLEKTYAISDHRILHVHGKVGDDVLQFGNALFIRDKEKTSYKVRKAIEQLGTEKPSLSYSQKDISDYLAEMENVFGKDPAKNIPSLDSFLNPYASMIDSLVFLGFSFGEQDEIYTEYLMKRFGRLKWWVSYYSEKEREQLTDKFSKYGCRPTLDSMENIIERLSKENEK